MSIRITLATLILLGTVSAAQAQTPAAGESKMDVSTNSGIKLDQSPLVNSIDTDKDGKVNKAEWAAIGGQEGIFTHTDKNTDGFMTLQELNDTTPPDSADANKDGKLTLPEFQALMKASAAQQPSGGAAPAGATPAAGASGAGAPPAGAPQK